MIQGTQAPSLAPRPMLPTAVPIQALPPARPIHAAPPGRTLTDTSSFPGAAGIEPKPSNRAQGFGPTFPRHDSNQHYSGWPNPTNHPPRASHNSPKRCCNQTAARIHSAQNVASLLRNTHNTRDDRPAIAPNNLPYPASSAPTCPAASLATITTNHRPTTQTPGFHTLPAPSKTSYPCRPHL